MRGMDGKPNTKDFCIVKECEAHHHPQVWYVELRWITYVNHLVDCEGGKSCLEVTLSLWVMCFL